MKSARQGDLVRVRYAPDRAWYPARVISVHHDHWIVRWEPSDPGIPPTYRVDDPEDDVR